jgi:transposase
MRKQYSAAFKARVVQELLKEEKTLAQIASQYEVHPCTGYLDHPFKN